METADCGEETEGFMNVLAYIWLATEKLKKKMLSHNLGFLIAPFDLRLPNLDTFVFDGLPIDFIVNSK